MISSTDTEAPSLICPPNQTIDTDFNKPTAVVVWTALATTDNFKLVPTITYDVENKSKCEIGETEVICKARDQTRNLGTCSFTVEVKGKA